MIYYVVGRIEKQIEVATSVPMPFVSKTVPLVWSDGQVGAMPVFSKREDAERYAEGAAVVEYADEEAA